MKFEYVILGLLAQKRYSGYELMKWLDSEGQFVRSNTHHSQIYRELAKMVKSGVVEFDIDPREGRPDAKVYRITEMGRELLLEWAASPYQPTSRFQDPDFSARLYFASAVSTTAATIKLIDTELDYRRAQIAVTRVRDRELRIDHPIPEFDAARAALLGEMAHQYGATAVDQWIDYLESLRSALIELEESGPSA